MNIRIRRMARIRTEHYP